MLIEFSVKNHRVFREKQTFSMVASSAAAKAESGQVFETGFAAVPFVLGEACIFGANGSGKSSLIDAMSLMKTIVRTSGKNTPDEKLPVKVFKFDPNYRVEPSEFEVVFIVDDTLYQYGFAATEDKILEEWLFSRSMQTGREKSIFSRLYNLESGDYDWKVSANNLKGERDSWKAQTNENSLFLSTAVRLKAKDLEPVFNWITRSWVLLSGAGHKVFDGFTLDWLKDEAKKKRVLDFLRCSDVELADISLTENELPPEMFGIIQAVYGSAGREDVPDITNMKVPEVSTYRLGCDDNPVALNLEEESTGTRNLFSLAAPIMDVLDRGYTLVVDELNTGLHPLAFQHLINLFASIENEKKSQLIFTTHDTSVADQELLGRDQIWFVEKGKDLAAKLVPLSDFKVRDAKGFQKKYLDGRFGGVPLVGRDK